MIRAGGDVINTVSDKDFSREGHCEPLHPSVPSVPSVVQFLPPGATRRKVVRNIRFYFPLSSPRMSLPFLLILLILSIGVSACGGDTNGTETGKPAMGGKRYGGVYRMNILRGSPNGLDPVLLNS